MPVWKSLAFTLCLFGISLAGIVIGWANWRLTQSRAGLTRSGRQAMAGSALLLMLSVGLLSGTGAYFFFDPDPILCTGAAVLATLIAYATLWLAVARA